MGMANTPDYFDQQQKKCLAEQLWLYYFNSTLYEKRLITEAQRNRINNMISCWNTQSNVVKNRMTNFKRRNRDSPSLATVLSFHLDSIKRPFPYPTYWTLPKLDFLQFTKHLLTTHHIGYIISAYSAFGRVNIKGPWALLLFSCSISKSWVMNCSSCLPSLV